MGVHQFQISLLQSTAMVWPLRLVALCYFGSWDKKPHSKTWVKNRENMTTRAVKGVYLFCIGLLVSMRYTKLCVIPPFSHIKVLCRSWGVLLQRYDRFYHLFKIWCLHYPLYWATEWHPCRQFIRLHAASSGATKGFIYYRATRILQRAQKQLLSKRVRQIHFTIVALTRRSEELTSLLPSNVIEKVYQVCWEGTSIATQ